jgi:D-sedoheptulose 7-phosphate isomerase
VSTAARLTTVVDELRLARSEANRAFFEAEAERIALACRDLAASFRRGGKLVALGGSGQQWSDARHVAVEFVHPVIVGKRALPALAVAPEHAGALTAGVDATMRFDPFVLRVGDDEWRFDPPSDDAFVRQELCETLYHVLWELVHVFLDHTAASTAGAGQAGFLYPFLSGQDVDLTPLVGDVTSSILLKAAEVGALREQTLTEARATLSEAASLVRWSFDEGGTLHAFGNGGSATDAIDLVADLRSPPHGWPSRRALDLTADSAILTALANDVGPEVLFARQLIAYGRAGDVAVAISTSGSSANIVEALVEARKRGLSTIALVGYDGGRVAAERLAEHVVVTRSDHIPRIQEAQAAAYHVLRELVELVER